MVRSRFVDLRQIRPGDIFLSRPRGIESSVIAFFGWSRFSHAEIVLEHSIYEATTDETSQGEIVGLVREKRLTDCQFQLTNTSLKKRLQSLNVGGKDLEPVKVKDITKYAEFEVLRLRCPPPQFDRFQRDLEKRCQRLFLQPYINLEAVARLTCVPTLVRITGTVTPWIPDHVIPGLFCSQLVAKIYKEGGSPLSDLLPEDMTPRHIASLAEGTNSVLMTIPQRELLFSPGRDYRITHDWREENRQLNQRSTKYRWHCQED